MSSTSKVKPTDAAIKKYHDALAAYAEHEASHEGATETAFANLLNDVARRWGWLLIKQRPLKVDGKTIKPDGTIRDGIFQNRGYWEAKDTDDDLDVEIQKKIAKKYPLTNTIFEDTQRAVLFQNGKRITEYDLTVERDIADLLNQFCEYVEPDHIGYKEAVMDFSERVPDLAEGLQNHIAEGHKSNSKFRAAYDDFFAMCQIALNPKISRETVDEMLVQHLLTERLFRTIFNDNEFTQRNVIAVEVEKVIAALVSKSFSRADFLKSLDKFYKAIGTRSRRSW